MGLRGLKKDCRDCRTDQRIKATCDAHELARRTAATVVFIFSISKRAPGKAYRSNCCDIVDLRYGAAGEVGHEVLLELFVARRARVGRHRDCGPAGVTVGRAVGLSVAVAGG